MDQPAHPMSDPTPHPAIEPWLEAFAVSRAPGGGAHPADLRTELDRYDIAVVLQAAYEWGGYRYTNASDAIAAAKRGAQ